MNNAFTKQSNQFIFSIVLLTKVVGLVKVAKMVSVVVRMAGVVRMVRVVNVTNSRVRTRFKLWPTEHYQYVPKELMHHRMPSKESKMWQVKI